MNEVNDKLEQICQLGLDIDSSNGSFVANTFLARKYAKENLRDQNYVLGEVLADTDDLDNVEYDICFYHVETHAKKLTNEEYVEFHKLAEANDAQTFIQELKTRSKDGEDVYADIAGDVQDYMNDIINELDSIILYLGGTITSEIPGIG